VSVSASAISVMIIDVIVNHVNPLDKDGGTTYEGLVWIYSRNVGRMNLLQLMYILRPIEGQQFKY